MAFRTQRLLARARLPLHEFATEAARAAAAPKDTDLTHVFQPEGAQTGSLPVLWHFRMSHYNEKVRWALDYKGIRHIRRTLVPGLHMLPLLRLSGQKRVPVLEFRGEIIEGSGAIIRAVESAYPEPPLFPSAPADRQRALELAQYFDDELGPALRLAFFHEILGDSALCTALFAQTLSAPARTLYRMGFPAVRALMRRELAIYTRSGHLQKQLLPKCTAKRHFFALLFLHSRNDPNPISSALQRTSNDL